MYLLFLKCRALNNVYSLFLNFPFFYFSFSTFKFSISAFLDFGFLDFPISVPFSENHRLEGETTAESFYYMLDSTLRVYINSTVYAENIISF